MSQQFAAGVLKHVTCALFKLMSFSFSEHLPLRQTRSRGNSAAGGRCDVRKSVQWNGTSQVRKYVRKFSLSKISFVLNNLQNFGSDLQVTTARGMQLTGSVCSTTLLLQQNMQN